MTTNNCIKKILWDSIWKFFYQKLHSSAFPNEKILSLIISFILTNKKQNHLNHLNVFNVFVLHCFLMMKKQVILMSMTLSRSTCLCNHPHFFYYIGINLDFKCYIEILKHNLCYKRCIFKSSTAMLVCCVHRICWKIIHVHQIRSLHTTTLATNENGSF